MEVPVQSLSSSEGGGENGNVPGKLHLRRDHIRSRWPLRSIFELSLLTLSEVDRDRAFLRGDREGFGLALASR
jgi:hypothetical protein